MVILNYNVDPVYEIFLMADIGRFEFQLASQKLSWRSWIIKSVLISKLGTRRCMRTGFDKHMRTGFGSTWGAHFPSGMSQLFSYSLNTGLSFVTCSCFLHAIVYYPPTTTSICISSIEALPHHILYWNSLLFTFPSVPIM